MKKTLKIIGIILIILLVITSMSYGLAVVYTEVTRKDDNITRIVEKSYVMIESWTAKEGEKEEEQTVKKVSNTKFYYSHLNSYEKKIYDKLLKYKTKMKNGKYKITFGTEFNKILKKSNGMKTMKKYYDNALNAFFWDNPDIFYLKAEKMYFNVITHISGSSKWYDVYIDSGKEKNYYADGITSKKQIEKYEKELEKITKDIINKTEGKTDFEKIRVVHDYLVDTVSYDGSLKGTNSHNLLGALIDKTCVCEGYSKAFKYILNKMGFNNIIAVGKARSIKGTEVHSWNYVKVNNNWYAVDPTWDDPTGDGAVFGRYKYFMVGRKQIFKDHTEEEGIKYPTLHKGKYRHIENDVNGAK